MFLQIKQLTKSYGARRVVSNVDIAMEEGEVVSLLGPSGCGKTTILRMIAGLVTPESGSIEIGGRVVYDGKRKVPVEERELGMVFQDFALWPHMTVAHNIAFGLRLRRVPSREIDKRIHELLTLVNLPDMGNRYPYQLSGGQQQRVAVARALATQPRLLLLDEPLSSLDAALREVMRTELVQLFNRLGMTAINVTHDRDEAMTMSDRIIVLRDGQVQQIGTPIELYAQPANAFVAAFMGAANLLPGAFEDGAGDGMGLVRVPQTLQSESVLLGVIHENVRSRLNGRAMLVCRPDHVQLSQEALPPDQPNVLKGIVLHSSFIGGHWRTLVHVAKEPVQPLLAFTGAPPRIDQQVWLHLPPSACQVIPE